MTQKECVQVVRAAGFSGYDKSLDSKANNPGKYGVQRTAEAQAALDAVATARKYVNTALFSGTKMPSTAFFVRLLRPHNTTGYYHRSGSVRAGALLFPPEGTPIPPIEPGGEYDPFRKDDEK